MLIRRGLSTDEAANLTAFLWGIPAGRARFDLRELNGLLFMRELTQAGRFGQRDGHLH